MEYVFGGVLIVAGGILIGLAYHNTIGQAYQVLLHGPGQETTTAAALNKNR